MRPTAGGGWLEALGPAQVHESGLSPQPRRIADANPEPADLPDGLPAFVDNPLHRGSVGHGVLACA